MAYATSLTPPSPGLSATLLSNKGVEPYSPKGPEDIKITTLYRCTGRLFRAATRHSDSYCGLYIICIKDPLEIQHPKFENSRLGFIESVHER